MAVSSSFRILVVDQLNRAVPRIRARPMFGGVGLYSGELFFALIADDTVYFKADASTRPEFEARGMEPFRPFGTKAEQCNIISFQRISSRIRRLFVFGLRRPSQSRA